MHQQLEQVETKSSMRSKQIQVVKVFGERVREARELCGFSQVKAAELLGYQNSSKLAKIEGATDTNSIPIWLIVRAAHIYDVSCDFLFGISDDWERDPVVSQQRQIGRWLFEHWEKAKLAEVNAIRMLSNKICTLEKMASKLLKRSQENLEMLRKVQELNPETFDDLKGGAKLLRLLTETAEDAMSISYELKRYKAMNEVAKKHDVDLFD